MHAQIELLLHQFLDNCDAGVIACSLVTDYAKSVLPCPTQLLDDTWRGTVASYLSKHAGANPQKVAVVYKEVKLCYLDLGEYAA
jgi:hypothetical protein